MTVQVSAPLTAVDGSCDPNLASHILRIDAKLPRVVRVVSSVDSVLTPASVRHSLL